MYIGKTTIDLASRDELDARSRAAIRSALEPLVADLHHDIGLVAASLRGPDPEYALYLFVEVLREMEGQGLRALEGSLSALRPLRAVA